MMEYSNIENHFHRLPTELIISIFDKIPDAKWLCICCSVSKHFAAIVLQTRFVSVLIPSPIHPLGGAPVINFLKKLHCVKSVTIRFSFGKTNYGWMVQQTPATLDRWKSDSSSFIFLFAKNCVASSDDDSIGMEATSKRTLKEFIHTTVSHLFDTKLGFRYIKELLAVLPNVKNVSVVDCMNQGSIVLEEEGIASVKKEEPFEVLDDCYVKWWRTSQVKLPFSKCVMKDVIIFSVLKTEACDGFMEKNLFGEKEYCELAMTLMKEEASSESTISLPMEANFGNTLSRAFLNFMIQLGVVRSF